MLALAAIFIYAVELRRNVASSSEIPLTVDWSALGPSTKTVITLQVVENPPLMRGSAIHDNAWKSLADLKTDKTRLALWYPYPRLAVAELAPPTESEISEDGGTLRRSSTA